VNKIGKNRDVEKLSGRLQNLFTMKRFRSGFPRSFAHWMQARLNLPPPRREWRVGLPESFGAERPWQFPPDLALVARDVRPSEALRLLSRIDFD
jgi:hypothetical protein